MTTIYVITPTYARATQKADLIRLSQTLQHITDVHWIVVEDANATSKLVTNVLKRSKLLYTQLSIRTPAFLLRQKKEPKWKKPRGVAQRNRALLWLRENIQLKKSNGVVYFADDDNTYDKDLFNKFRNTKRVSVWPVGLVGGLRFEGPRCNNGKITGWRVVFDPNRPFPFDMAGFAINLELILENYQAHFSSSVAPGYLESSLLSSLVQDKTQLETITPNCREILVWHTTTARAHLNREPYVKAAKTLEDDKVEV
ncbi:uncharacterized protein TRIADDRAFT_49638 [Trichoplax adhaerens]|uniref:Galactosylgalactosylxylosylprotein 3-beta-glucuronosyltransferase n=1 Tax=Trichoplax adhaerens TaxID=10228 RepID=B3RKX0_TRIAD|nr:hypothetical protein TRIADDRAFT_49638 [Trichoplax adhaerens]EDV28661.1 hypothetical protein TRIADDRAFT_49638 [Trichoplax adhaerens]|eukprot:XP_002107863.1 hypothetical protein TRIADDRAFT_49638 [Trichoplax adhaerens]